jgi:two-component system nitrogen regulation sensor histidine kinase GlnL
VDDHPFEVGRVTRAPAPPPHAALAAAFDVWPEAALILGPQDELIGANEAGQELLVRGLPPIARNPVFTQAARPGLGGLVDLARREAGPVRERDLALSLAGGGSLVADAAATPLDEGGVLVTLHLRPQAGAPDRPGEARARRSVMGMGQMMAHEVKNPLAGIRGAAQLLRDASDLGGAEAMALAQLIIDETDRIRRLVDRMEALADDAAPVLAPVNVHQVLDRVRAIAANGVADGLTIAEAYDPSLPPALADEDQLIQVFLNIVKNAAEAARARGDGRGELTLSTAYRHGFRVRSADGVSLRAANLEVRVTDNGPGVPDRLRDNLFEPFVTTKPGGAGLGLALTAKLVTAQDGLIDFESRPGRTTFRVLLPAAPVSRPAPHPELVR